MYNEIIERIKNTDIYKKQKIVQENITFLEEHKIPFRLLDTAQACDIKILLSDFLELIKEDDENFSTEDAQVEFIFEHFHEMGIECNFTDFCDLTKEQYALCMYHATNHYCYENL